MKQLSLLTACLFAFFVSQAQSNSTKPEKKQKSFIVTIRTLDNKTIEGRLYAINDSQLVLANSVKISPDPLVTNDLQYIPGDNIASFSLKKKNRILKGAVIGFGIGAATGIVIGLASGDDRVSEDWLRNVFNMTAGEKAIAGGLALGVGGAIVGTIIGVAAKKKFIIDGKKNKFSDLQTEITMKLDQK